MYGMRDIGKVTISAVSLLTMLCANSAFAAGPGEDWFGRNTGSPMTLPTTRLPIQPPPAGQSRSQAQLFYDAMDNAIITHRPSEQETITLKRPFGHEFNQVAVWTNTAATVAHKYRELARILRSMPTPGQMASNPNGSDTVANYKSSLADWYDDSAAWLEDYIKPRVAASTQEELKDALQQMTERSMQLKELHTSLEQMDTKLRDQYGARHFEDAIWKYASKPLPK